MSAKSDLAAVRAELHALKDNFDQRVRERCELLLKAQKVGPGAVFGANMTDDEIRARAVAYTKGHAAIEGRSPIYIEAVFDSIAEQAPVDTVRLAMLTAVRTH